MGPRDRAEDAAEDAKFREQVLSGIDGLKGQYAEFNGRFKKLEHTVFGDEEAGRVGLTERIRGLESGWAKLTTVAILACSVGIEGTKWLFNAAAAWFHSGLKTQ